MLRLVRLLAVVVITATGAIDTAHARDPQLRIAVAANFRLTLDRLIEAFREGHAVDVEVSSGATGLLYGQIVQGAPFDLFFAADIARPRRLEQEGLVVDGSRFIYAVGRLALWHPGRPANDAIGEVLRTGTIKVLAIANPATAPYGVAAEQVLYSLGFRDDPPFRIVRGESLGQTFQFVASGNADAGFVALSQLSEYDALNDGNSVRDAVIVPAHLHDPIVQGAVWLARAGDNESAGAFVGFVRSERGLSIIAEAGYALPTAL